MKKKEKIYARDGNTAIFATAPGKTAYMFSVSSTSSNWTDELNNFYSNTEYDREKSIVGGFDIVAYGSNNNMPKEIRDILEIHHLSEGILGRQEGLLWGTGPVLFTPVIKEGALQREYVEDRQVLDWLKSFNYETYLQKCVIDFLHTQGVFTKYFRNRGPRIGAPGFIASIEHVAVEKARLAWPENGQIRNIIVGDWDYNRDFWVYPKWDKSDPFRNPQSMVYCNKVSFARPYYPVPSFYGAMNWINRASAIPQILKALSDNSLNIKWHIQSPSRYWSDQAVRLKAQCEQSGTTYTDQTLEDFKDEFFQKMGDVFSNVKNVGKFLTTETFINEFGQLEGWKIEAIDQQVNDFVTAQLEIAKYADSATTSGFRLHPSLSNLMVDGKLASGSEQLYALKLYLATEVNIPESVVCQAINDAIEVNWPGKNIKVGFHREIVKTEDSVSSGDRLKNNV